MIDAWGYKMYNKLKTNVIKSRHMDNLANTEKDLFCLHAWLRENMMRSEFC